MSLLSKGLRSGPPFSPDPVLSPNSASGSKWDLINASSGLPTFCTLSPPSLSCLLSSGASPVSLTEADRMAAWWRNRQCSAGQGQTHGSRPHSSETLQSQAWSSAQWAQVLVMCPDCSNNPGLKRPSYPSDQFPPKHRWAGVGGHVNYALGPLGFSAGLALSQAPSSPLHPGPFCPAAAQLTGCGCGLRATG